MLAVELGSRIAGMSATQNLIIHGPRPFRLAKVGSRESEYDTMRHSVYRIIELFVSLTII